LENKVFNISDGRCKHEVHEVYRLPNSRGNTVTTTTFKPVLNKRCVSAE